MWRLQGFHVKRDSCEYYVNNCCLCTLPNIIFYYIFSGFDLMGWNEFLLLVQWTKTWMSSTINQFILKVSLAHSVTYIIHRYSFIQTRYSKSRTRYVPVREYNRSRSGFIEKKKDLLTIIHRTWQMESEGTGQYMYYLFGPLVVHNFSSYMYLYFIRFLLLSSVFCLFFFLFFLFFWSRIWILTSLFCSFILMLWYFLFCSNI